MHLKQGFSFIELLISLSLISIFTAFSLGSIHSFRERSQSELCRTALIQAIQLARNTSLMRQEKILLSPLYNEWQKGCVMTRSSGEILRTFIFHSPHRQLHWRTFPLHATKLTFLPTGLLDMQNGTFWLCLEKKSFPEWAIIINKAGRLRSLNPDQNQQIVDAEGIPLPC